MDTLSQRLAPVRSRMLANRFVETLLPALAWAWGLAALVLLCRRLTGLPDVPAAWLAGGSAALALAWALIRTAASRPSLVQAALMADRRLSTAERFASAVQVRGETPMEQAVLADAERHLGRLHPAATCPLVLPRRRAGAAGAALALLAGAWALPPMDMLNRRKPPAGPPLEVTAAAKRLEQRIRKIQEDPRTQAKEAGEIGKALEQLQADLKEGVQDPAQALAGINDLQAKLRQEMEQFKEKDKAELAKDLQRALKAQDPSAGASGSGQNDALKDLLEEVKELAAKAEAGKASAQDAAEMRQKLSELAEQMAKEGGASRQMAEELSKTAESLRQDGGMPEAGESLRQLAESLGEMDRTLDKEEVLQMAQADLEELRRQLGGQAQDPWKGEVSEQERREFEQRMQELAEAPPDQPGGT